MNTTQLDMLRKLLRHNATDRVVRLLSKLRPAEIAEVFTRIAPAEQRMLVDVLFAHGKVADIFVEIAPDILEYLFDGLEDERISALLSAVAPDDGVFFISLLPDERVEPILAQVPTKQRERIEHLRLYPPDSAGAMMTSQLLLIPEDLTSQQAIERIRELGQESEFVFYVYVVNEHGTFVGVVPLRRLITCRGDRLVRDLMVTNPVAVFATDDRERVVELTSRYNLLAVPVVDAEFRLLGVITVDDVIDVMREEASEDMYLMQGVGEGDRVYTSIRRSVSSRLPWTMVNLLTASAAASVIGLFEDTIGRLVALATFMPIVAGVGGNGGTQTLTVITRGIALGELSLAQSKTVIWKQILIGLINGAGAGVVTGLIAWALKGNGALGFVLFLAMLVNMALAGLVGAAVPLILKAVNLDPALGSGILVTAVTDSCGFLAFLGLATLFMPYLV
jgi:magnesium transporter